MDEETKRLLDAMEARLTARIDALLARMNNQHERVLNDLTGLRSDFVNTREFLLHDSAVRGRQWLDLEARVTKLEKQERIVVGRVTAADAGGNPPN